MSDEEKEKKITKHVIACAKCRAHVLRIGIGNIRRGGVSIEEVKKGACQKGACLVEELYGQGVLR